MNRLWFHLMLRMMLGMFFAIVVIGGPIYYTIFASTPLEPFALAMRWSPDHLLIRLAICLFYITALSGIFALGSARGAPNLFDELSASIRRIALRDFGVRLGPYKFKEWVRQQRFVVERNADYTWGPEFFETAGEAPAVESIVVVPAALHVHVGDFWKFLPH